MKKIISWKTRNWITKNNIRNEINIRIILTQNIRDNNNNNYNYNNLNEDDFNNDKKGENNVFIKNEMNQDIFD